MISNSTPLICLAKLEKIELLKKLFKKIIIPEEVKKEVLIKGKEDYGIIGRAIEEGWIIVESLKINPDLGLGAGENAAINLAREKKDSLIIDDAFAIKAGRAVGIEYFRTTSLILISLKKKMINKEMAKNLIYGLVREGYYISSSILARLMEKIDAF